MEYLFDKIINNKKLIFADFEKIINADNIEIFKVFYLTSSLKKHFKKEKIKLCSIINAKSGRCPENCAFCAQSAHYDTGIKTFPLISPETILDNAKTKEANGAHRFSIVTSGTAIKSDEDKDKVLEAVRLITTKTRLKCCASLGIIDNDFMKELKKAGLTGYHHNLETSASFFDKICSTHNYNNDIETVKNTKQQGFYTCSGGILGLGENWEHRIEMAFTLKELGVDSVALNFLNPIKGTKLENADYLTPIECLKIVAVFRIVMPDKDIRICGGREVNLRDYQSFLFPAGANGLMIGNYLTTKGRNIKNDFQMMKDFDIETE